MAIDSDNMVRTDLQNFGSPTLRIKDQNEFSDQVAEFLARGGKIRQVDSYTINDLKKPWGREQQDPYEHVRVYVRDVMTRRGNRSRPPIKNIAVNIGVPYEVVDSIWRQELVKVSSMNGNRARKKTLQTKSKTHMADHPKVGAELNGKEEYKLQPCVNCGNEMRHTTNDKCTVCYDAHRNRRRPSKYE